MERTLRGMLEQELDSLIKLETLEKTNQWFGLLTPMHTKEDALFGFVVGALFSRFLSIMEMEYRREPNDNELKEFFEIIERRTIDIKSQIKLALSK